MNSRTVYLHEHEQDKTFLERFFWKLFKEFENNGSATQ